MGPLLPALGCTEAELRALYLILLPVNAIIYRGDQECEERYRLDCPTPASTWKAGVEQVLAIHGVDDAGIRAELSSLQRFALEESQIMRGELELDEARFTDVCSRRSSDIRLLVRLACHLMDIPADGLLRVMRPLLVWEEIRDDLGSYEDDVRENSFNALRTFVWMYGPDEAPRRLADLMRRLIEQSVEELASADRTDLVRVWRMAVGAPGPPARLAPRALLLRRTRERLRSYDEQTTIPTVVADPR
jgi:hypothetical protein